jgi:thiamine-monophosphate kinase
MVRRATARAGDHIFVSGTLGDSGLGLRLLVDPACAAEWKLSDPQAGWLRGRYLRPSPRLALRDALLRHARASMDISDGLMKDLGRMCRASGVGASVDDTALPLSRVFIAVRDGEPGAARASLFAGDDYEILTAIPHDRVAHFTADARLAGIDVTEIGMFTTGNAVRLKGRDGSDVDAGMPGWDHF